MKRPFYIFNNIGITLLLNKSTVYYEFNDKYFYLKQMKYVFNYHFYQYVSIIFVIINYGEKHF